MMLLLIKATFSLFRDIAKVDFYVPLNWLSDCSVLSQ